VRGNANQFSLREIEVIQHWANGLDASEIAQKLGINERTIKTYQNHLRRFFRIFAIQGDSDVDRCRRWLDEAGVPRAS
jgi:ATP/maltotriose-dependent transcriptional regulator MalT